MNTKTVWVIVIVVILLIGGVSAIYLYECKGGSCFSSDQPKIAAPADNGVQDISELIHVDMPLADVLVQSPIVVRGEAVGSWYFEGSFPVKIFDANGKQLGAFPAEAKGDWMTTDFVPFQATSTFDTPTTETGTVIFQKDNPSGLPANDRSITIPVYFSANASKL